MVETEGREKESRRNSANIIGKGLSLVQSKCGGLESAVHMNMVEVFPRFQHVIVAEF
jgi:hypothetical protein